MAPNRINSTYDMWNSIKIDGYSTLITHFIHREQNLHKNILLFFEMVPPHIDKVITSKLLNLLDKRGLENKLGTFTLHNASTNDTYIALLMDQLVNTKTLMLKSEPFHSSFCAHILHLSIQYGLKEVDPISDTLRKCKIC